MCRQVSFSTLGPTTAHNAGFQLTLKLYEAPASGLSKSYEPPAVVRTSTSIVTATSGYEMAGNVYQGRI